MQDINMKNFILFLIVFVKINLVLGYEEQWSIVQLKKPVLAANQILIEYVRRDRPNLFQDKFLDLARASWITPINSWNILIGAAYIDFAKGNPESRLHQFVIKNTALTDILKINWRLGAEQRNFATDSNTYWRARARGQINYELTASYGLAAYDELFYSVNGHQRFKSGFNENRFGYGVFIKNKFFDIYLFNVQAELRNLKNTQFPQWQQLQMIINI